MHNSTGFSVLHREAIMALDAACRIKRCDNLYSGEETLIRFINYFRRHHWPYARFSSRMCTCAVCPKTHSFVFL